MEKIENGQNIINTIEPEIPKNLAKDFDDEIDDIFTKLGTLSPSNGSFDSPITLNRNKKFFKDFMSDISHPLRRNTTNKIFNYKSNLKSINIVERPKKVLKIKNDYLYNTETREYRTNKIIKTTEVKIIKKIVLL